MSEQQILDPVNIDIERALRQTSEDKGTLCFLIGETEKYRLYYYDEHQLSSLGLFLGHVLRQSKTDPQEVVFFGIYSEISCIFNGVFFRVDNPMIGRPSILTTNIETGIEEKYDWVVGKRFYWMRVGGSVHAKCQDHITKIWTEGDSLFLNVIRTKGGEFDTTEISSDDIYNDEKYNCDLEYNIEVTVRNGRYQRTIHFPLQPSSNNSNGPLENDVCDTALGRNVQKQLACRYKDRENECSDSCLKCTFFMKEDADKLLAQKKALLAIQQYKRAVFANPSFADAWVGLGNAFSMNAEHNHALAAYNRAINIDPTYGQALLGKAVTLRELGRLDDALSLAESILCLYDNEEVRKVRDTLMPVGVTVTGGSYSLDAAIDKLTNLAYDILLENDLLGPENEVVTEHAICQKEEFSAQILRFCKKRYSSSGKKKFQSESILTAFYSSLCATLFYYEDNQGFVDVDSFDYIANHIDLEKAENVAEKMLGIRGNKSSCDALWNLIYDYVQDALGIFEMVELDSDIDLAVLDATENAYMMGMMYAMKHNGT